MTRLKIVKRATKICYCCKTPMRRFYFDGRPMMACPNCSENIKYRLTKSDLPRRAYKPMSFLTINADNKPLIKDMAATLKDFLLLAKGSWLLHGHTGCGKTIHAATFGYNLIRRHGISVKFMQVSEYLNRLKQMFSGHEETSVKPLIPSLDGIPPTPEEDLLNIRKAPVLVMDDINRRYSDFELETIYDIVDFRYRNNLFTIFTAQDIELKRLPEQTSSRIQDMSYAYNLGGDNRRKCYN